ncbi:tRNA 5-methoxyuridine(34)/uridine 5-oxyacetic acid(34) synthase CmoB [Halieaceae bacterium IMCC14734]|uniref:tRNA U34 carboxymethyltransferase n=1 Tax=Candidatus Litorirhabdus singularis TaxID=2518993 RepID=A0ABT3TJ19_9GAMM|nr:tRNA 5-methoxyuridine(34)/uridine 5-oxyacetic acid(34) synthase CmoB [Candidatus Litorirhabdus singularis]MCX2982317.1 tRNA 5-methoxyuridine(34)/uridine 5-oxyacetic acid(34) synthase CmoB [Candidatus Litorirhabdus singularis]
MTTTIDYQPLVQRWQDTPLQPWADILQEQIGADFHSRRYGDLPRWLEALEALPTITEAAVILDQAVVQVGQSQQLSDAEKIQLETALRQLHPWRKGPFDLFGVHIDTEWRSDIKWSRLQSQLGTLEGQRVLDVGCGSGYHSWRMLGAGAAEVIGIDPTPLFVVQFWALQRYIQNPNIWVLPLGIQHVPAQLQAFDSVFSMGILYHRRSPIDHLTELRDALAPGGKLILETLVIEGGPNDCLVPQGRYARMGNVWFIPSCEQLCTWLRKLGYKNIEVIDVSVTTPAEQRSTDWMQFQSLADFLDPKDSSLSIEGYPAPTRAMVVANK